MVRYCKINLILKKVKMAYNLELRGVLINSKGKLTINL